MISKTKFTALPNEIIKNGLIGEFNGFEYYKPGKPLFKKNLNRLNNIIIGIAVGVMISACGVIYLLGSLMN